MNPRFYPAGMYSPLSGGQAEKMARASRPAPGYMYMPPLMWISCPVT
jgi:hypothetical protein